jgi:DNA-binding Xre family transcriptional regulator
LKKSKPWSVNNQGFLDFSVDPFKGTDLQEKKKKKKREVEGGKTMRRSNSNNKVVARPPKVTAIAQKIVATKNYLAEQFRQVGIEEANINLLSKVVTSVLARVAEIEGCKVEDLLGEVRVIKPTPSDPAIMFRGRVMVWWL